MLTHTTPPRTIKEYMTRNPVTIIETASIQEAFQTMEENGLRHLPVVDHQRLVGVISDRDIAMSLAAAPGKFLNVRQAMTSNPYSVSSDSEIKDALKIMAANKLGCVVVKDNGENVVGIFTVTDAVRLLSDVFYPTRH